MNPAAILHSQGWLGTGHSLQPNGRGLKKPLTVSKKSNLYGVGKKKVDVHADQWWARVFDSGLKRLDLDKDRGKGWEGEGDEGGLEVKGGKGGGSEMETQVVSKKVSRFGFGGFVQGESLRGTFSSYVQERGGVEGGNEGGGEGNMERVEEQVVVTKGGDSTAAIVEIFSDQKLPREKKGKKRKSSRPVTDSSLALSKSKDKEEVAQKRISLRQDVLGEESSDLQESSLSLQQVAIVESTPRHKTVMDSTPKSTKEIKDASLKDHEKRRNKRKRRHQD